MPVSNNELQPDAEAVMRLLEAAARVNRRHQFFGWMQSHLCGILPTAVIACGTYLRSRRGLAFDVFNNFVLPPQVMSELADERSQLLRGAVDTWVLQEGRVVVIDATALAAGPDRRDAIAAAGLHTMLGHGVARPQRPTELESFFLFGEPGYQLRQRDLGNLEILLPCLHATYLRVVATEIDMRARGTAAKLEPPPLPAMAQALSERERQVLAQVGEGKNNAEIGQKLGISALTVKNHVQNILRKLGAANRAQAIAKAGVVVSAGRAPLVEHPAERSHARQPCLD